jgi:hypothetical protein
LAGINAVGEYRCRAFGADVDNELAFAFGDDTALVMGPSGFPVPPTTYLDAVNELYLHLPGTSVESLTTPEGLYPVTGFNTLPLDSSVAQGEATLNNAILQQIADQNHVEVFGYSQSSIISSGALPLREAGAINISEFASLIPQSRDNLCGSTTSTEFSQKKGCGFT